MEQQLSLSKFEEIVFEPEPFYSNWLGCPFGPLFHCSNHGRLAHGCEVQGADSVILDWDPLESESEWYPLETPLTPLTCPDSVTFLRPSHRLSIFESSHHTLTQIYEAIFKLTNWIVAKTTLKWQVQNRAFAQNVKFSDSKKPNSC
jgi:hypothetical protein